MPNRNGGSCLTNNDQTSGLVSQVMLTQKRVRHVSTLALTDHGTFRYRSCDCCWNFGGENMRKKMQTNLLVNIIYWFICWWQGIESEFLER
jgi:hypothetical protein